MTKSARIAPPNSVVLVSDATGGEIPKSMDDCLISSTTSCIAIGCRSEADGETDIALGALLEVAQGGSPDFEGLVATPSRRIVVRTVLGDTILDATVPATNTNVRVWVNDPQ